MSHKVEVKRDYSENIELKSGDYFISDKGEVFTLRRVTMGFETRWYIFSIKDSYSYEAEDAFEVVAGLRKLPSGSMFTVEICDKP